jgi:hypothetical protein
MNAKAPAMIAEHRHVTSKYESVQTSYDRYLYGLLVCSTCNREHHPPGDVAIYTTIIHAHSGTILY